MDNKIRILIYNELIKEYQDRQYEPMKEFVFEKYLNKLDNIDNILSFIDFVSKWDKIIFLKKLMKKLKFTKEEFYTDDKNTKIILLCELHKKGKLKISEEYNLCEDFEDIFSKIKEDMDGGISKQKLEEFLNKGKCFVIERLELLKIIFEKYDSQEVYIKNNHHFSIFLRVFQLVRKIDKLNF